MEVRQVDTIKVKTWRYCLFVIFSIIAVILTLELLTV